MPDEIQSAPANLMEASQANVPTQSSQSEQTSTAASEASTSPNTSAEWYYADGIKGEGPKPDYLIDSKYKSMAEQAKGYHELRKTLGGFTGAPEGDYELNFAEGDESLANYKLDPEDPTLKTFKEFAKEQHMSQETFSNLLKFKAKAEQAYVDQVKTDLENKTVDEIKAFQKTELAKLGDNAKERLVNLDTWWRQNFPDYAPEKMHQFATSADFVQMMETIKDKLSYTKVPTGAQANPPLPADQLREMLADPRYISDPDYQARVDAEYERAYQE